MHTIQDEAFGVVPVYTKADKSFLFCLVRHAAGHWAFPKGHREAGESERETALRELREETGISEVSLFDQPGFKEVYSFEQGGARYDKTVTYFIGQVSSIENATPSDFTDEILESMWATYDEAKQKLDFKEAKKVLDEAAAFLGRNT